MKAGVRTTRDVLVDDQRALSATVREGELEIIIHDIGYGGARVAIPLVAARTFAHALFEDLHTRPPHHIAETGPLPSHGPLRASD